MKSTFFTVGIDASAGGLQFVEALLSHRPERINLALVVMQHLDPRHQSIVPTLLGRAT